VPRRRSLRRLGLLSCPLLVGLYELAVDIEKALTTPGGATLRLPDEELLRRLAATTNEREREASPR
jgi:hypothetical protein